MQIRAKIADKMSERFDVLTVPRYVPVNLYINMTCTYVCGPAIPLFEGPGVIRHINS